MKTWDEIRVEEKLSFEEFYTLLADKLPLTDEEKAELINYHKMYETFLTADVTPVNAWVTVRNIFVLKNPQIGERLKSNTLTL